MLGLLWRMEMLLRILGLTVLVRVLMMLLLYDGLVLRLQCVFGDGRLLGLVKRLSILLTDNAIAAFTIRC